MLQGKLNKNRKLKIWKGMLEYYLDLLKNGEFSEDEKLYIRKCITFIEDMINRISAGNPSTVWINWPSNEVKNEK